MIPFTKSLLAFLFIFPGAAALNEITAYVSGTAEFRCLLPNDKKDTSKQLIISWEKEAKPQNIVVAENFKGERKYNHINEIYKNRSMKFKDHGDLELHNITLEDEGVYGCYIREKQSEHKLTVLANFSVPQINSGSLTVVKNGTDVLFHCSSRDGFPKPYGILWEVSDDNRTEYHHQFCNLESRLSCKMDSNSQTYSISSEFEVMVNSNISVTCVVLAHHNFSSTTVHIVLKDERLPKENDHLKYILLCGFLTAFTIIACTVYFCYKKNGKTFNLRSSQNNRETSRTADPNNDIQQREETTSFV
ncbi:T-lymphocyte activation antigen CD86 isoform X2 [Eleutherodactylus coqui]